jgi:diaminohydroxyphosphoribosylaminopyrimidine deaminase/5-amino-6-(5-phosphoribosylamino)uracil reductase
MMDKATEKCNSCEITDKTAARKCTQRRITMTDEEYMREAIELSGLGEGGVNPNPLVGAVIVKNNEIIGRGAHLKYGREHAERNAIADARAKGFDVSGATLYVTLEPCCHQGHQPPCTSAIIEAGISRVVIGSRDPNPLVHGKGVRILKEHGIEVREDLLRDECDRINPVFFHYITTRTPYVVMKCAQSLDGKIATVTGESRYISGEASRLDVMRMRNKYKAIMIGIGTALADDPLLTCRIPSGKNESPAAVSHGSDSESELSAANTNIERNPVRIVCDKSLRLPVDSRLVLTADTVPLIIACAEDVPESAAAVYEKKGAHIIRCPLADGEPDLKFLMKKLGEMEIDGLLLEGGGTLNASMLSNGLVDEVQLFIAPVILGGKAKTAVEGAGVNDLLSAYRFRIIETAKSGEDLRIRCVRE